MNQPPEWAMREARELAIEIVDGVNGFTYEFAPSPAQHLADYDAVQEKIAAALAAQRAAGWQMGRAKGVAIADATRQSYTNGGARNACVDIRDSIAALPDEPPQDEAPR